MGCDGCVYINIYKYKYKYILVTNLGEGQLWIQTYQILLKIDLVSHPNHMEGLVNTHTHTHTQTQFILFRGKDYIRGILVKVLDGGVIVCEFDLQSHYYVHFWTNTFEKGMNYIFFLAMGLIVPLLIFY